MPASVMSCLGRGSLSAMPNFLESLRPSSTVCNAVADPWQDDRRVWRAAVHGLATGRCMPTGFAPLDAELPGGGWPTRMLCEVLMEVPGAGEWRLLAPALRAGTKPHPDGARWGLRGRRGKGSLSKAVLLINPPRTPHLAGLLAEGLEGVNWVWIAPEGPKHVLWATEQAIRSQAAAAVLAWLPEARPEHLRRLQVAALNSTGPVFAMRPLAASAQPSAAPLRVQVRCDSPWQLQVNVLKRRGPPQAEWLTLSAVPRSLSPFMTPRMQRVGEPQPAGASISVSVDDAALARPAQPAHG